MKGVRVDALPGRGLFKELSETFLLFAAVGLTLVGYLGVALALVEAMK